MTRFARILSLVLVCLLPAAAMAGDLPDPRTMTFPPLTFHIPEGKRVVLGNGMVVYLMEDHELPQVSITACIGTGSIYDPPGKTGLAGLTGTVMRTGGTRALPPEKLDDELEFMASSVESSVGSDAGTVSMTSLTRNLPRTLEIFAQVLMAPAFREDKVELARKQEIEALRRQNDNPKEVANRELARAIYAGSSLGRFPTVSSVKAVTRADMVAFHRRYFHPNNVILSVAGDFRGPEMVAALNRVFAGWKRVTVDFSPVEAPKTAMHGEVLHVEKEVNQSVIRMGHIGIDKNNPDLYAIRVMDAILGSGGFNSRLMSEIRTSQGLAYNVASSFDVGRRFLGTFVAQTETKVQSTARTVALMMQIIEGMTEKPVTDRELTLAKDSIINSFIFAFTNTAAVVNQQARLEYYHFPAGYLEHYRANIARVTKEDVLRVAKKYLHPEAMILVVVGDAQKFDKPLSTFGPVREIKLDTAD